MFAVARESVTNPAYQALEREWQPKLAASSDEMLFNQGLFKRIEAVYEALPGSRLDPEQVRLVTRMYEHFVRRGAQLNATDKQRLSEINQDLARAVRRVPRQRCWRTRTHRRSSTVERRS